MDNLAPVIKGGKARRKFNKIMHQYTGNNRGSSFSPHPKILSRHQIWELCIPNASSQYPAYTHQGVLMGEFMTAKTW